MWNPCPPDFFKNQSDLSTFLCFSRRIVRLLALLGLSHITEPEPLPVGFEQPAPGQCILGAIEIG